MQCKHSLVDGPVEQRDQLQSNDTSCDTVRTYNWHWSTQRPNIVIHQPYNYVHEVTIYLYFNYEYELSDPHISLSCSLLT